MPNGGIRDGTKFVGMDTMLIRLMTFWIMDVIEVECCFAFNISSSTAILPNVCLPNHPLTKKVFIANLT